ncbi:MAG: hypothetical protein ACI81V_001242 [Lentimonas sp.]|jgi:hypothetical protein
MKTTDPHDPLDKQIDALLASRPLGKNPQFTQRVLAALEAESESKPEAQPDSKWMLKYALPLAAALALSFTFIKAKPEQLIPASTALSIAEVQEIMLLEDALGEFAKLEGTLSLNSKALEQTLESLYQDIKS